MKFKKWLENTIDKALFLVHPDFALDNWPYEKYLHNLKNYYQNVKNYVNNFDGHVLIHSFVPRHANDFDGEYGSTSKANIDEYLKFTQWMHSSKAKVVVEKKDLCEKPDDLFNLIDNLGNDSVVYWGGGYLGDCLSRTLKFVQDFEQDMKNKNVRFVPVKNLIFVPGSTPTTYDQIPDESMARQIAGSLGTLPDMFQQSVRDAGIHPEIENKLVRRRSAFDGFIDPFTK